MGSNRQNRFTPSAFAASLCLVPNAQAEDSAELAKKALNPVAALYSLPVQYNWDQKMGPSGEGMHSVANIQPVLPFALNEEWNLISRTILPVIDQHGLVDGGGADKSGVGDITQSFFFSPKQPTASGWILGGGPAILIPTGSDELLGSEQWGMGPTVVALQQANGWTHGVLANHIWGLDGSPPDDKQKINQTFLQPFLSYTTPTAWSYALNTESTIVALDKELGFGQRWQFEMEDPILGRKISHTYQVEQLLDEIAEPYRVPLVTGKL